MKDFIYKNADSITITIGFCVCIVVGYYIGVERSFSAFEIIMRTDSSL